MNKKNITQVLPATVKALTECDYGNLLADCQHDGEPMPSGRVLAEVVELVRSIVFPGYFGEPIKDDNTLEYRIGLNVAKVYDRGCPCSCRGNGEARRKHESHRQGGP